MSDVAEFTNSLGMIIRRIEPGRFLMGNDRPLADEIVRLGHWRYGNLDERPVHWVTITEPFGLSETPVTNAQYEQFDPAHRELRGKMGFSTDDDEAVVFVNWHDAVRFCEWLSEREEKPYRLPTEAEWEYACRAGTTTAYHTGDTLPPEFLTNAGSVWYPTVRNPDIDHPVPLPVGKTPPNAWGLRDMHGLVEEWCGDWYGAYEEHVYVNPVGPTFGDFRVTRGGSHSTEAYYLRSANRSGCLPEERHWYVGFRVAMGDEPQPARVRNADWIERHQWNVISTVPESIETGPDADSPCFAGPLEYVNIPHDSFGPLYGTHNHDPGFAVCPNGDLLAIWYTCVEEPGRELGIAASRRRFDRVAGRLAPTWDEPSIFWDAPGKNDHAPALWSDGARLYHFNGLSAGATWGPLATILRTSDDSGATWSSARIIIPEYGPRHMPIAGVFALRDGTIVLPCDTPGGGKEGVEPGTALWLSQDGGETWYDAGGTIAGIHAGVVELADGSLLAYGRGRDIDGMMARSVSNDRGKTWQYDASPFPGIRSGQRIVLMRMKGACDHGSDPLVLVSFAKEPLDSPNAFRITDASGAKRPITGMFAAVSFDDGATWPFARPVTDDGPDRFISCMDGRAQRFGRSRAEWNGYLAGAQAANGVVHVISSWNEYAFNLAWLCERPPALDS